MSSCLARCLWIRELLYTGGPVVAWRALAVKQIVSFFKQRRLRFDISNMRVCYANFPEILVFHCAGHTWNNFDVGSCLGVLRVSVSMSDVSLAARILKSFLSWTLLAACRKRASPQTKLLYLCCKKRVWGEMLISLVAASLPRESTRARRSYK